MKTPGAQGSPHLGMTSKCFLNQLENLMYTDVIILHRFGLETGGSMQMSDVLYDLLVAVGGRFGEIGGVGGQVDGKLDLSLRVRISATWCRNFPFPSLRPCGSALCKCFRRCSVRYLSQKFLLQ